MVGGFIEIKNAFITGYEETVSYKQVPNPNYVASTETKPENKIPAIIEGIMCIPRSLFK